MAEFPILDSHRLRTFFPHTPALRQECSSKPFRTTMELTFLIDREGRNLKRAQSQRACTACRRKKVHPTCLCILNPVADQCRNDVSTTGQKTLEQSQDNKNIAQHNNMRMVQKLVLSCPPKQGAEALQRDVQDWRGRHCLPAPKKSIL